VYGRMTDGYVLDIGGIERYQQAQADVLAGTVRIYLSDAALTGPPDTGRATIGVHRSC
jgi:hypothetical protein